MTGLELTRNVLATYRLQRLLGRDVITEGLRDRAVGALWLRRPRQAAWLDKMLECPWCRTVWAAGIVWALHQARPARPVLDVLALAGAGSLIAVHLDPE